MFGSGKKSRKNKMFSEDAAAQLDSLYTTALRLTGQPAEAEDLVHDTFVRALRFRHRFEPGTNLRAWLFKMMVNLFTNNYRRQRRGQDISHGAEQQALLERNYARQKLHASEQPEEFFFEKLFSQDVVQAIEQLPLDFRLVVLLVDIEEFSYAQVASILDIPVGTVGDCYDRYRVRIEEMRQSLSIIEQAMAQMPKGAIINREVPPVLYPPVGETYGHIESPKGEYGYYLVSDGGVAPYRLHIRPTTLLNLTALREMIRGWKIADAIVIFGSIDICLGEVDR